MAGSQTLAAQANMSKTVKDLAELDTFWEALDYECDGDPAQGRQDLESLQQNVHSKAAGRRGFAQVINSFANSYDIVFTSTGHIGRVQRFDKVPLASGDLVISIATARMLFCVRAVQQGKQIAYKLLKTAYVAGRHTL